MRSSASWRSSIRQPEKVLQQGAIPTLPSPSPETLISGLAAPRRLRRPLQFALFITSLTWFVLSEALAVRAARGLTNRFDIDIASPLISALFLIFLLVVGFGLLHRIAPTGTLTLRTVLGLPRRSSSRREWALGAAIGWGVAIAAVLPMALSRSLHVRFWTESRAFHLLLWNLATLVFAALAIEIALRGYPFRRLIDATGPAWATILMALLFGSIHGFSQGATGISILVTMIVSLVLSLAWLRTHGLWLPWGLHAAWTVTLALLFGLPVRGALEISSVIQTRAIGPAWLTGGELGPEGAIFTIIALIAGIIVLVRTTRDYAWDYTRPELIPAGYEVNPPPPAAHTAMEQEVAAKPPALVQILPTTPQTRSVDDP